MNKTFLFIIATFSISLSNAMLTQYNRNAHNLDTIPIPSDIIKKIIYHATEDFSPDDLSVNNYRTFNKFRHISQHSEGFSRSVKNHCLVMQTYFQVVWTVPCVNKDLYNRLSEYRNAVFKPLNESRPRVRCFLDAYTLSNVTKCFIIKFVNFTTFRNVIVSPANKHHNEPLTIPECRVSLKATMNTKNAHPQIFWRVKIYIPKEQSHCSILEQPKNEQIPYADPLLKEIQAIQTLANKNIDINNKNLFYIESLFTNLTQCVFNNGGVKAKKIEAIIELCKYAFEHFDDHQQLNNQIKKVSITPIPMQDFMRITTVPDIETILKYGVEITFNFNPYNEQIVPLDLIDNILRIK